MPQNKPSQNATIPHQLGLLGYGTSGRFFHLPFLRQVPRLALAAIASRQHELINKECPNVTRYDTPEALIEDPTISCVIITSPNACHYAHALYALDCGKHVVIDKPFTLSLADALALQKKAEEKNLLLTAYHNRRFDSDFVTLKEYIQTGALGEILLFESFFDQYKTVSTKWKEHPRDPGAGIVYDIAPHLLDQVLQLFGMPDQITTDSRALRPHTEVSDYFSCALFYPKKHVVVGAHHLAAHHRPRFIVHGTMGTLISVNKDNQEARARMSNVTSAGPVITHYYPDKTTKNVPLIASSYAQFYQQLSTALDFTDPEKLPVLMAAVIQVGSLLDTLTSKASLSYQKNPVY